VVLSNISKPNVICSFNLILTGISFRKCKLFYVPHVST